MSKIKLQSDASGSGTLTIASPNTNSDYTLNLPASSGTVLADGASQSPTFNGVTATTLTVNSNNISAVNSLGFRNRIINGDMRIDQRNAGAAVTNLDGYLVDRWMSSSFGAAPVGRVTGQRSTLAPAGFQNSFQLTVTTPSTSLAATEAYLYRQMIEGFNVADLEWGTANAKTVTISFWARSSVPGNYTVALNNGAPTRAYVAQFTINSANTWEFETVTIPGDTTGTWATDNTTAIQFIIGLSGGTSRTQSAGSWQNTTIPMTCATGQTNWIGTNGATFYITGVQLEAGSVATPFERRDYGRELMMCQRYYYRLNANGGSTNYLGIAGAFTSTRILTAPITVPVPLRVDAASTSVTFSNCLYYTLNLSSGIPITSIAAWAGNNFALSMDTYVASGLIANNPYQFAISAGGFIAVSAEL